jgi:molybdate transport system substrate-binding protein
VFLVLIMLVLSLLAPSSALAQAACEPASGGGPTSPPAPATPVALAAEFPADGGELTVFAAASLVDAFADIVDQIQTTYPNVSITVETGGSQALVTQLQEGATADVLATANPSTMNTATESNLIDGEPLVFTGNRLVIVAPSDNPAGISSLDDLATEGTRVVLAAREVPVGNYARTSLCAYADSGAAPEGFLDAFNANIVSEELDVRDVLAKIQLGEGDAGIVYASDAVAAELNGDPVSVIEFPHAVNVTAVYPIAPVAGGNTDLANAFIAYVLSAEGQAILESYGFVYP